MESFGTSRRRSRFSGPRLTLHRTIGTFSARSSPASQPTDREAVKASLVGGIGTDVSPFAVQGQIQPLDVAVVLGPIGWVRLWDHPGPSQHLAEGPRAVAVAFVGDYPFYPDAQLGRVGYVGCSVICFITLRRPRWYRDRPQPSGVRG